MQEIIREIFTEIHEALNRCMSPKPVPFEESLFKQELEGIERRWLNENT